MSPAGICLSCQSEIPSSALAVALLHHLAAVAGQIPTRPAEDAALVHKVMLTVAGLQVAAGPVLLLILLAMLWRLSRRRKQAPSHNRTGG